ncbi:MAG: TetR/AcrR family transcriptional regulator, partial [Pseudomonadota bacterium]
GAAAERIDRFLSLPAAARWRDHDERGCFLCNASADFAVKDTRTFERIEHGRAKLLVALETALSEICLDRVDADPKPIGHFLLGVYTGLRVLARSGASNNVLDDIKRQAMETVSKL